MRFSTFSIVALLAPLTTAHLSSPTPTVDIKPWAKLQPFEAAITEAPVPFERMLSGNPKVKGKGRSPALDPNRIDAHLGLLKRQDSCPASFSPCDSVNNPGLCCREGTNCSLDNGGNVGCCPTDAVCTGTVFGSITSGTISVSDDTGVLVSGTNTANTAGISSTTTDDASGTSSVGFIINSSSTVGTPSRASGGLLEQWLLEGMMLVAGAVGFLV